MSSQPKSLAKHLGDEEGEPMELWKMWEANRVIRARLREDNHSGRLVRWPSPELVGKPSMTAIAMNANALVLVAKWWCPKQSSPKSPSVDHLRKQVRW